MAISADQVRHLDQVLTGLAMYDAYVNRDAETLSALTGQVPAQEAVTCLLGALELMNGIFASQLGSSPTRIADQVRESVIRQIANQGPRKG